MWKRIQFIRVECENDKNNNRAIAIKQYWLFRPIKIKIHAHTNINMIFKHTRSHSHTQRLDIHRKWSLGKKPNATTKIHTINECKKMIINDDLSECNLKAVLDLHSIIENRYILYIMCKHKCTLHTLKCIDAVDCRVNMDIFVCLNWHIEMNLNWIFDPSHSQNTEAVLGAFLDFWYEISHGNLVHIHAYYHISCDGGNRSFVQSVCNAYKTVHKTIR